MLDQRHEDRVEHATLVRTGQLTGVDEEDHVDERHLADELGQRVPADEDVVDVDAGDRGGPGSVHDGSGRRRSISSAERSRSSSSEMGSGHARACCAALT